MSRRPTSERQVMMAEGSLNTSGARMSNDIKNHEEVVAVTRAAAARAAAARAAAAHAVMESRRGSAEKHLSSSMATSSLLSRQDEHPTRVTCQQAKAAAPVVQGGVRNFASPLHAQSPAKPKQLSQRLSRAHTDEERRERLAVERLCTLAAGRSEPSNAATNFATVNEQATVSLLQRHTRVPSSQQHRYVSPVIVAPSMHAADVGSGLTRKAKATCARRARRDHARLCAAATAKAMSLRLNSTAASDAGYRRQDFRTPNASVVEGGAPLQRSQRPPEEVGARPARAAIAAGDTEAPCSAAPSSVTAQITFVTQELRPMASAPAAVTKTSGVGRRSCVTLCSTDVPRAMELDDCLPSSAVEASSPESRGGDRELGTFPGGEATPKATSADVPTASEAAVAAGSPLASSRPDSDGSPTPSAPWLVQEALYVKTAVEAAVRGAGCSGANGLALGGAMAASSGGRGEKWRFGKGKMSPDKAISEVPRLVADLHAALGRGVSSSEAKAWVCRLERLEKGLDDETLLEACSEVSREIAAPAMPAEPSTSPGAPAEIPAPPLEPTHASSCSPKAAPALVVSEASDSSRAPDAPISANQLVAGLPRDKDAATMPLDLGGKHGDRNAVFGSHGACDDGVRSADKCGNLSTTEASGLAETPLPVHVGREIATNDDSESNPQRGAADAPNSTSVGSSVVAKAGMYEELGTAHSSAVPVGIASVLAPGATQDEAAHEKVEELDGEAEAKEGVASKESGSVGVESGKRRGKRRNATKIPDDVISKVPCLSADLNAALGCNVGIQIVKDCVRSLDRCGQGLSREALLDGCLEHLRMSDRETLATKLRLPAGQDPGNPAAQDDGSSSISSSCSNGCTSSGMTSPPSVVVAQLEQQACMLPAATVKSTCRTTLVLSDSTRACPSVREAGPATVVPATATSTSLPHGQSAPALRVSAANNGAAAASNALAPLAQGPALKTADADLKRLPSSCVPDPGSGVTQSGGDVSNGGGGGGGVSTGRGSHGGGGCEAPAVSGSVSSNDVIRRSGPNPVVLVQMAAPGAGNIINASARGGGSRGSGLSSAGGTSGCRVSKRSRSLIPDSVIAKVPRLLIDLESFVGYRVSADEAKAHCRELERCGEGLSQQELCDACICVLLRRARRGRPRGERGNSRPAATGRGDKGGSTQAFDESAGAGAERQLQTRSLRHGRSSPAETIPTGKQVTRGKDDRGGGGGGTEASKGKTGAGGDFSGSAHGVSRVGSGSVGEDSRCRIREGDAGNTWTKRASEDAVGEAKERPRRSESAARRGVRDRVEPCLIQGGRPREEFGSVGQGRAVEGRVRKRPRLSSGMLPESVIVKVPSLSVHLGKLMGRSVSASESKAACRSLDQFGEGLSMEDLAEACARLIRAQAAGSGSTDGRDVVRRVCDASKEKEVTVYPSKGAVTRVSSEKHGARAAEPLGSCSSQSGSSSRRGRSSADSSIAVSKECDGKARTSGRGKEDVEDESAGICVPQGGAPRQDERYLEEALSESGNSQAEVFSEEPKAVNTASSGTSCRNGSVVLPDSVLAKLTQLAADLETFLGYPVFTADAEASCRKLDRCGEGLTQQELCDACVSLLLSRDADCVLVGGLGAVGCNAANEACLPPAMIRPRADEGRGGGHRGGRSDANPAVLSRQFRPSERSPDHASVLATVERPCARETGGPLIKGEDHGNVFRDSSGLRLDDDPHRAGHMTCDERHQQEAVELRAAAAAAAAASATALHHSNGQRPSAHAGQSNGAIVIAACDGDRKPMYERTEPEAMASPRKTGSSCSDVCFAGPCNIPRVSGAIRKDGEGSKLHVSAEEDSLTNQAHRFKEGQFAVFVTPATSPVPFLVGKILSVRPTSRPGAPEILLHWFTPKTTVRTAAADDSIVKAAGRWAVSGGSTSCEGASDLAAPLEAAGDAAGAAVANYGVGGWSPVYVPGPTSRRLVRDTGVEPLAAALLVFPRLLSSDALPAGVRDAVKKAKVAAALAAVPTAPSSGRSGPEKRE